MSRERQLISQEIRRAQDRLRGVVVSPPTQKFFDPSGTQFLTWVVDVDVGGNRILRDVPVKLAVQAGGGRGYARVGYPVFLERDARGRYQVIGPGDRRPAQGNVTVLDEDAGTGASAGQTGFTVVREVFDFYKGTTPESFFDPATDPDTLVWLRAYDHLNGQRANIELDGANVTALLDKSSAGIYDARDATAATNPDIVATATPNGRSAVVFDGSNDRLLFDTNIPGEVLSIFIACTKDAVGSGNDVLLQTEDYEILSRQTSGDTWGVFTGTTTTDSGSTITSTFTLIELVCRAFDDIDLYQDGQFLLNVTAAGTGAANSSSFLGHDGVTRPHLGKVTELLILDRAVSAVDRVAIEAYFDQAMNVAFSRWNDGVTPFPKVTIYDSQGNPV